jgi:hypothetical protein
MITKEKKEGDAGECVALDFQILNRDYGQG